MLEEWKPIEGYDGIYEISNLGNVRGCDRYVKFGSQMRLQKGQTLTPYKKPSGYISIALCKNRSQKTVSLHRLVAIHFISNEKQLPAVNHIDGNKDNNTVKNLEWCTFQHNSQHAFQLGLISIPKGSNNHMHGKTGGRSHNKKLLKCNKTGAIMTVKDAAISFGCCYDQMSRMINGKKKNISSFRKLEPE